MTEQTIETPSLTLPLLYAIQAAHAAVLCASNDDVTPVITGAVFALPGAEPGVVNPVSHRLRMIATDRYAVGRFTFPDEADLMEDPATPHYALPDTPAPHTGWWVPGDALAFISKLVIAKSDTPSKTAERRLRIEWELEVREVAAGFSGPGGTREHRVIRSVLIEVLYAGKVQQAQRFDVGAMSGSYPPVERLIPIDPKPVEGPLAMSADLLAIPGAWLRKIGEKRTPGAPSHVARFLATVSGNDRKPGPVLFRACATGAPALVGFDGAIQPSLILGDKTDGWAW